MSKKVEITAELYHTLKAEGLDVDVKFYLVLNTAKNNKAVKRKSKRRVQNRVATTLIRVADDWAGVSLPSQISDDVAVDIARCYVDSDDTRVEHRPSKILGMMLAEVRGISYKDASNWIGKMINWGVLEIAE